MDLTKLSDADLLALKAGDYSKVSDEGLKALKASSAPEQTEGTLSDVVKSTAAGAAKGTLGMIGGIPAMAGAAKSAANKYLFDPLLSRLPGAYQGNPDELGAPDVNAAASPDALQKDVEQVTGKFHAPQTTAGKVAETVGTFLPGVLGGPESFASRLLTRAVAPGVASEAAGQATEGTAAEPWARVGGAVAGGALAGRLAALKAGTKEIPKPSVDDVKAEASNLYNSPELKNLKLHAQPVNQLGSSIKQDLENASLYAEDHAPVFNQLNRLEQMQGPVDFGRIEAVKKQLGELAGQTQDFRPTATAKAAMQAKRQVEDFIDNIGTPHVASGNPVAAMDALKAARANSGAAIRTEQVMNKLDNAGVDNAVSNSAMNLQNKTRQSLKTFLKNGEAKMAGYNDEERAAMRKLVLGSTGMNALRYAGNAIGGSGITVGPYVLTGHAGLAALGYALKKGAGIATQRMGNKMSDMLLSRAPLAQGIEAQNVGIRAANSAAANAAMRRAALRASALSLLTPKTQ